MSFSCDIVNPQFNNKPSKLYTQLVQKYGKQAAMPMWVRSVEDVSIYKKEELQASGEPTVEAVEVRFGTPSTAQLNSEHTERLLGIARKAAANFKARLASHEERQKGKSAVGTPGFEAKRSTLLKERKLVDRINTAPENVAFLEMVEYAVTDLRGMLQFLREKYRPESQEHNEALLEIAQHLETYGVLAAPELALQNSKLRDTLNSLNTLFGETQQLLIEKQLTTKTVQYAGLSTNPALKDNPEAVKQHLVEGKDVDGASRYLMNLQSSSVPAVALEGKVAALTTEEVQDAVNEKRQQLEEEVKALVAAQGNKDLSWLHQLDDKGKTTGRYVAKVGQQYWDEKRKLKEQLLDEEGEPLAYIPGPANMLTKEQREHNIRLAALQRKYNDFRRAEIKGKKGEFTDGPNSRYTLEFKQQRAYWQQYRVGADGKKGWLPNLETQDYLGAEKFARGYEDFMAEHYSEEFPVWQLITDDARQPTGAVEQRFIRSVRREYVEEGYADQWQNSRYRAIYADNSEKGKARQRFYEYVDSTMQYYLDQMPAGVRSSMRNSLPVMLAAKASDLNSRSTASFLTNLKASLTSGFSLEVFTRGRYVDEDGRMAHDLPKEFVGGYRNEKAIARAQTVIKQLQEQKLHIITKEGEQAYTEKLQAAERRLALENNKLEGAQTETDILRSLGGFIEMGENYVGMRKVETSMLSAIEVLERRNVYETNSLGEVQEISTPDGKRPLMKRQGEERASGQLWDWMLQNLYQETGVDKTVVDKLAEGAVAYGSQVALGLNFMAAAKNYLSAKFGTAVEGRARRYFRTEDADHAILEGTKASANRIGNIMESIVSLEEKKVPIKSDFDATIAFFNVIQSGSEIQNQKTSSQLMNKGMALTEGVEYTVQSESAYAWMNARVLDKDGQVITREELAERLGVDEKSDAFRTAWKEMPRLSKAVIHVNGRPQLREGITLSKETKHNISVQIKNMNKELFGNYDQKDKVALKKEWLGRMVLQFHGWVGPMAKARFGAKYYDEGTGMEMEGRYRVMYRIFRNLLKTGEVAQKYKSLTQLEKANVRRTLWEIGYAFSLLALAAVLKGLAGKLPEDEDKARAALNFLQRTSLATGGELMTFTSPMQIYQNLKNPLPATRLVGQVGTLLANIGGAVYYPATGQTDKLYYKTGVQKDNLKAWKSVKDLMPILSIDRQIDQLAVSGEFFVR